MNRLHCAWSPTPQAYPRFLPVEPPLRRRALSREGSVSFVLRGSPRSGTPRVGICLALRARGDAMGVLEAFGERVGLSSMQERISLLGGRFEVNSAPGEGTTVTVEVPIYAGEGESG